MGSGATPNLRKPPKTIRGPLIEQIDTAVRAVLDELAQGLGGLTSIIRRPEK